MRDKVQSSEGAVRSVFMWEPSIERGSALRVGQGDRVSEIRDADLQNSVHRPCVRNHSVLAAEIGRRPDAPRPRHPGARVDASRQQVRTLSQSRGLPGATRVGRRVCAGDAYALQRSTRPFYNHQSMRAPPSPRPPPSTASTATAGCGSHSDNGAVETGSTRRGCSRAWTGRWRRRGASRCKVLCKVRTTRPLPGHHRVRARHGAHGQIATP